MNNLEWKKLTEVYGQWKAESLKSMLNAYDIPVNLFQESAGGNFGFPVNVGKFARVQIFVRISDYAAAKKLLEEFGDQLTEDTPSD